MSTARIDAYLKRLPDWQRANLVRFREAVHRISPSVEEGWKWDVPVFLVKGRLVLSTAAFAGHTKYNFFNGAALRDPHHLFNSGLESKKSRSINLADGEAVDAAHLDELIRDSLSAAGAELAEAR